MFLSKILPATGLYCVAMLLPNGGFRHFFHADLTIAEQQLGALSLQGHNVYIAQATYDETKIRTAQEHNAGRRNGERMKERSQDNAVYLRNFFLDIDCGEKWPLKNQREAADELKRFLSETGLPFPAVVNSGNGLYAHWIMQDDVPATQWQTIARLLKQVVAAYSPALGGDASRTADTASVLRPPGTTNRKPGKAEKPVVVIRDMPPIEFMDFVRVLSAAAKKKQINRAMTLAPKPVADLNAEFLVYQETANDANLIADKCAQIGHIRETRGDVTEPLWYAGIGVLIHCVDGEEVVHEWSQGHPEYSHDQTQKKISQWLDSGMGPSTCATLGSIESSACIGCPHNGKIKSPIVLGRPEPEALPAPAEDVDVPQGYKRTESGLYFDREGQWVRFYDQDLFIDRLAYDESLGYEVMTIRHSLPYEGDLECTLRSSLVHDPKALLTTLSDNHIKVVGVKEKQAMVGYIESYQARIQRARKMTLLLCQMGWKETRSGDPMFVLGKRIFHVDGSVEDASMARNIPKAVEGFCTCGELAPWTKMTKLLNLPGMEPFAFAFLAGAFGAPLMKFTGHNGALVSMVGPSGAGKTMVQRMIMSAWGHHNSLMMAKGDTYNAVVSRLGVYNNLPMVIDEVTNMSGIELSNLAYGITQGRDKNRLTKNAEERKVVNKWNTLGVTSSNASILEALSVAKIDATAEINRVFEYYVSDHPKFRGQIATNAYWTLDENYGHAGEKYAQWVVQNLEAVKKALTTMQERVERDSGLQSEERFWGAVCSVALTGGVIAKSLGLIDIDVVRVRDWAVETIRRMRGDKTDQMTDAVSLLGKFLDSHVRNRLIVRTDAATKKTIILEAPNSDLDYRWEVDTNNLWLSRQTIKPWITKQFGSYTAMKNELVEKGVLLDSGCRKVLGAGTYFATSQQICWRINIAHPSLGRRGMEYMNQAKILEQAPGLVPMDIARAALEGIEV